MTLSEQMAADVAAVFLNENEHAEAAWYHAKGKDAARVSIIINRGEDLAVRVSDYQQESVANASIFCSTDDVPEPCRGDKFEMVTGEEIWMIDERTSRDGKKGQFIACVLVTRDTIGAHQQNRR